MNKAINYCVRVGVIGTLYLVLTYITYPISFGQIQVRIAESLTLLPYIYPEAVLGVTIGCFLANIFSPFGIIDMVFGTMITFLAAILTMLLGKHKRPVYMAPLPPIILNAFGVALYVVPLMGLMGSEGFRISFLEVIRTIPLNFKVSLYFLGVIWIGIGEAIATYGLGIPLVIAIERRRKIAI